MVCCACIYRSRTRDRPSETARRKRKHRRTCVVSSKRLTGGKGVLLQEYVRRSALSKSEKEAYILYPRDTSSTSCMNSTDEEISESNL